MSERRRGLGRGLGALIPAAPQEKQVPAPGVAQAPPGAAPVLTADRGVAAAKVTSLPQAAMAPEAERVIQESEEAPEPVASAGAHFAEVPIGSITPNPRQPREVFDEDALAELVTSIKEVGLLQPVVVRQVGPERYELIMGERRWRACREAGLERIPAIVRATDDEKLLLDALLENLHRAQLNPLEEAAAYDQLLKDFNCTHDQLADRIGRSRPQVSNTLRLLRLSPRAAQGRGRSAVGRSCAGSPVGGRLRGAGPAGASHCGRGALGACCRRDRDADGLASAEHAQGEGTEGWCPAVMRRSPIWHRVSRTASRPG